MLFTNRATIAARAVLGASLGALLFALAGPALARDSVGAPSPLEIGDTQSGNYLAALIAGDERDTSAAATYFREALRADPRNPDLIERAFAAALANGNMSDAFDLADRLLVRDPNNSLARLTEACRAFAEGQYAVARAQLAGGGAGKAHDLTTSLLTAWTYAGAGDSRRALDTLDRIGDASVAVFRDYHAGLIASLLGNAPEAAKRLKAAYDAEKNTLRLADAYARNLDRHGDAAGAKKIYEDMQRVLPHHPLVDSALADLAAGKTLDPIVRNAKDGAAEVLYGLGAAGSRQGDELAALIYLRLALLLKPDHALAIVTVADLYLQLKQNQAAIDAYEKVPRDSPMRVGADIQAALALDGMGRSDEAIKRLQDLVAAHPDNVEAVSALGSLQRAAKKFDVAADTYSKAIALLNPPERSNWTLYYFRGICYERSKQWPKAEADFKKALELFPDQPLVLNYLGYSWVDQGANLDEAFKMLQRAVDLRPSDGYIVDSLGWAYYKLGHYDQAVTLLEKAVELKPADPVVNDHLGDAYWKVGRKLDAHFQWNHSRDMGPDPEDLPRILKKIQSGLPEAPETPTAAQVEPKKDGG
ncbi:MAG TPA: tetratricopeptide repeat protein [Roseiarcus sp.]|nr:tetratricopeptide repeat protein [Roseiarcus sp.]